MAGHESILRGESLGLVIVEPDQRAESMQETADLLYRARAGDLDAFEQLIRRRCGCCAERKTRRTPPKKSTCASTSTWAGSNRTRI